MFLPAVSAVPGFLCGVEQEGQVNDDGEEIQKIRVILTNRRNKRQITFKKE
jgi:hypothetical protein